MTEQDANAAGTSNSLNVHFADSLKPLAWMFGALILALVITLPISAYAIFKAQRASEDVAKAQTDYETIEKRYETELRLEAYWQQRVNLRLEANGISMNDSTKRSK